MGKVWERYIGFADDDDAQFEIRIRFVSGQVIAVRKND